MSKPFLQSRSIRRSRRDFQTGLSLIELMIAIVLGMLVVAAVLAVYLNISRANSELAKANSQIENGRFALQILENDVVHAGYWGTYVPPFDDLTSTAGPDATGYVPGTPLGVPDPCKDPTTWTNADKDYMIGIPVQSYASSTVDTCTLVTNWQTNTDVLVVRHANTCVAGVGSCEADTAGKMYFQAALCNAQITAGPAYVLAAAGFDRQQANCATPAEKRKFISNIYYVRNYSVTQGDGIPTLMRSSFDLSGGTNAQQGAQPLVEGIEGFHVELGIDSASSTGTVDYTTKTNWTNPNNLIATTNRGDGVPDSYVSCPGTGCSVAQLRDVVAVKIYVLARAKDKTAGYTDTKTYTLGSVTLGPFNDSYKRHVFSTTVRLTDVSGRREAI